MARTKEKSTAGSLLELVMIVAVALGLALGIQAFLVKPFRIPSESMVPTLEIGQRVLVDRVSKNFSDYDRGDVLVFKPPAGADTNTCGVQPLRALGLPAAHRRPLGHELHQARGGRRRRPPQGDRRRASTSTASARRSRSSGPTTGCGICNLPEEITIPKGYYFMMGDNRGASADSREWGPVPKDWVIGQAFATYWPPGRDRHCSKRTCRRRRPAPRLPPSVRL